jgi:NifU-like protein involved in Fe-S cluster formation
MSAPLYNRDFLRMAVALSEFPLAALDDDPSAVRAEMRSPLCGSRVTLAVALDAAGKIARVGIRADACALGQASAALMARHAVGRNAADMAAAAADVAAWLAGDAPLPDWPDFALLAAARDYPARHGSIVLPFRAAAAALRGDRATNEAAA